jgi:hypothetical protein
VSERAGLDTLSKTETPNASIDIVEDNELKAIPFAEFLESIPPAKEIKVTDLSMVVNLSRDGKLYYQVKSPDLNLHCKSAQCSGPRFFRRKDSDMKPYSTRIAQFHLRYTCSNCQTTDKIFAVHARFEDDGSARCFKIGEYPPYGPPTPTRLLKLLGENRDLFLKGRRCEYQGLGIGAFVYYRRVVESQKNRILDEVIKVSEKIGAPADVLRALRDAKKEVQFSRAIDSAKGAIPPALLIRGHNPLTLLHSALSAGVHEMTDESCLKYAQDIRAVLAEFSESVGRVLKDESELNAALTRLMNARQDHKSPKE